jgi:hypothetical protein
MHAHEPKDRGSVENGFSDPVDPEGASETTATLRQKTAKLLA